MRNQPIKQEVIRNVPAFIRSYVKSQSGERALLRQPAYREVDTKFYRGRIITGSNQLALALAAA